MRLGIYLCLVNTMCRSEHKIFANESSTTNVLPALLGSETRHVGIASPWNRLPPLPTAFPSFPHFQSSIHNQDFHVDNQEAIDQDNHSLTTSLLASASPTNFFLVGQLICEAPGMQDSTISLQSTHQSTTSTVDMSQSASHTFSDVSKQKQTQP